MSSTVGDNEGGGAMGGNKALIAYVVFFFGAASAVVILTVVRAAGIVTPSADLPLLTIRVVGLVLLVIGFVVTGVLSGRIPPKKSGEDDSAWWQANSSDAVATWATAEGIAILGGVFWLLTGDVILLIGLAGGGLVLLLLNRPQRMMAG